MNPLLWLGLGLFGIVAVLLVKIVSVIHRSRSGKRSAHGPELIGSDGTVSTRLAPVGSILIKGELWPAGTNDEQIVETGTRVKVVGSRGHVLKVTVLQKS